MSSLSAFEVLISLLHAGKIFIYLYILLSGMQAELQDKLEIKSLLPALLLRLL